MKGSLEVARAAISLAITPSRGEEENLIKQLKDDEIQGAALDVGGEAISQSHVIIERAIIAARKSGIIQEGEIQDGVVAGAARDALNQILVKALGLNCGGKVAVCRSGPHLSVCIFMSVGMMYLNDVVIGLGHRVLND